MMKAGLGRPRTDVLRTDAVYEFGRIINFEYFRRMHCARFYGVNNIPAHGPFIFAPNHASYYDPPLVACGIPFRMRFMAWDALFSVPVLKRILISYGAYPVKLKSADKKAIVQTLKILRNGEAVMIFPEGGREKTGELEGFEQGAARMALQTGAMVIPVSVTGVFRAWPVTNMLPRLFVPLQVKYHPPIDSKLIQADDLKERMDILNEMVARPIRRRLKAYDRLRARHRKA